MANEMYCVKASDEKILKKAECGGAVTAIFKYLLDKKLVDGVLALKKGADVYDGILTFVTSSDDLIDTAGSMHCAPTMWGRIIKDYLKDVKIAVSVKPCDMRAIVELSKRGKVNLDNIYMIGLNCGGTVPPKTAIEMIKLYYEVDPNDVVKEEIDKGKFIIVLKDGTHKEVKMHDLEDMGYGRRTNCQRCDVKVPRKADLAAGNWGIIGEDAGKYTFVEVCTEKGKKLLEDAEKEGYIFKKNPNPKGIEIREKVEISMLKMGEEYKKKWLEENYPTEEKFNEYWNRCIKCYGCRDACPVFDENEILEDPNKGEIPPNPVFFQESRAKYMAYACVNCGQCEDACPMEIPVARYFHKIQEKERSESGYKPGVDDKLPKY